MIKRIKQWIKFKICNVKVWPGAYVYPTAHIGSNTSIGRNSEIGNNVVIGENVKIGYGCFIPEGFVIDDNVFIGPSFTGTNDRYPPSPKENWEKTFIAKGARIGAGVTVICGVTIYQNALVGAGSVVTKDVETNSTTYGVPAKARKILNVPLKREAC